MLQNTILQHLLFFAPIFCCEKLFLRNLQFTSSLLILFQQQRSKFYHRLFWHNLLAYARTSRAHYRDFMFFAVTSVTPHNLITCILHNYVLFCYFTLIPRKEFADFTPKTTRCLMKNITSFCEKQHVVLWGTTRRFVKNNTSFCEKQHVVFAQKSLVRTPQKETNPLTFFEFQSQTSKQSS